MCNLYSHTRNVEAMRKLFAKFDDVGVNLPPQPSIFPDYSVPIIRNGEGGPRLAMTRWGMPSSKDARGVRGLDDGTVGAGVGGEQVHG